MVNRKQRTTIANKTVKICERGEYRLETDEVVSIAENLQQAIEGTRHYTPEDFDSVFSRRAEVLSEQTTSGPMTVRVENSTTFAAAKSLLSADGAERVVCLNFASAKSPGGGFLSGSQAQEEALARASGLYPCINSVQAYYETNRNCGTALYTDHMIYSPDVPVFRDDDDQLISDPFPVSIITAPAVNRGALMENSPGDGAKVADVMRARIERVLSIAVAHGHRRIVLGAWGCGVFRNEPADVAQWFYERLYESPAFAGAFDSVIFAVLDGTPTRRFIKPFEARFAHQKAEA